MMLQQSEPTMAEKIAARQARQQLAEQFASAFEKPFKRPRASILYQFALLLAAVAMVSLVAIYLGLIGLTGYGVFLYAQNGLTIFTEKGSGIGKLIMYVTPILAGLAIIFFMIKPFLARRALEIPPRPLRREDEPVLFALLDGLCQAIRAPRPSLVQVDAEVNASASPHRGLFSLLRRRLTLTIGLPLAAGCTVGELTGVIAHEFGHFSQGSGMLLTYIVRSINHWFARVVYERDAWDEMLRNASRTGDLRVRVIFYAVRLVIWLLRRILWVLMHVARVVCSFTMRQMEFDADRYETRIGGSEQFIVTSNKIHLLSLANAKTLSDLGESLQEKRLGDDLPAMVAANLELLPEETREAFLAKVLAEKTGLFDTHPATRARIRSAQKEKAAGLFHDERPAAILFSDFADLCRQVTIDFYGSRLGPAVAQCQILPTRELLGEQSQQVDTYKAISSFCHGLISPTRPLGLDPASLGAPADPRAVAHALKSDREAFAALSAAARQHLKGFGEARGSLAQADVVELLWKSQIKFSPGELGLKRATPPEIQQLRTRAEAECEAAEMAVAPVEDLLRRRLCGALRLLHTPQMCQRIPEAPELLRTAEQVAAALDVYAQAFPLMREVHQHLAIVRMLLERLEGKQEVKMNVWEEIQHAGRRLADKMEMLRSFLQAARYPFTHGEGDVSLAHYALDKFPDRDNPADVFHCGDAMFDRLTTFYGRAVGTLAITAEKVEQTLGLPPLPTPARGAKEDEG